MSGLSELPKMTAFWRSPWRERLAELSAELEAGGMSPDEAAREAERRVRGEHFLSEMRRMKERMGTRPERRPPPRKTWVDRYD